MNGKYSRLSLVRHFSLFRYSSLNFGANLSKCPILYEGNWSIFCKFWKIANGSYIFCSFQTAVAIDLNLILAFCCFASFYQLIWFLGAQVSIYYSQLVECQTLLISDFQNGSQLLKQNYDHIECQDYLRQWRNETGNQRSYWKQTPSHFKVHKIKRQRLVKSPATRCHERTSRYPAFERQLFDDFNKAKNNKLNISGSIFMEWARQPTGTLNIKNFNFSSGWFTNFKIGSLCFCAQLWIELKNCPTFFYC